MIQDLVGFGWYGDMHGDVTRCTGVKRDLNEPVPNRWLELPVKPIILAKDNFDVPGILLSDIQVYTVKVNLEKHTIRELFEQSKKLYGDLPCTTFVGEKPIPYKETGVRIDYLIAELRKIGVGKGCRVAIYGDNAPNWVIAYLATTSIAAVAVPILPGFPEEDVRHIIRDADVEVLFVSDKYRSALDDIGKSKLRMVYALEDFSGEAFAAAGKADSAQQVLALDDAPRPEPEDLAAIIYTSGTTGFSKGVMLTHDNIVRDVVLAIERFPIDKNDRFLSILPLSHTFEATGGMLCPLAVGVSIHYMKGLPTPKKLLSAMETVKPTGVLTVPLVVDKIYRKRIQPKLLDSRITSGLMKVGFARKQLHKIAGKKLIQSLGGELRFFMFGGASLNEDVELFLRDAGISYSTGYGMTETSPIISINPFGKVKVGSCGQPIPGIEVKIHDADKQSRVGEILVKGPIVMQGYYKNPEATAAAFLEGGWLRTGDLGLFDEEGYLFIKGRSKNVIVGSSGENIYPEIIEQRLLMHPLIQDVIVYQTAERVVAKAYLDQDVLDMGYVDEKIDAADRDDYRRAKLEEVRNETNALLPAFSHIVEIVEHPEPFEKTPTNKVKRYLYVPKTES